MNFKSELINFAYLTVVLEFVALAKEHFYEGTVKSRLAVIYNNFRGIFH